MCKGSPRYSICVCVCVCVCVLVRSKFVFTLPRLSYLQSNFTTVTTSTEGDKNGDENDDKEGNKNGDANGDKDGDKNGDASDDKDGDTGGGKNGSQNVKRSEANSTGGAGSGEGEVCMYL